MPITSPVIYNSPISAAGGPFNETGLPFTLPATTGLSYIGDVSQEWIADLPVFETPFDADPKEYIYRLLYRVKVSAFRSMARDAAGPYGGYHVGESGFQTSKGGILSFNREFARVPDSRNEYESIVFAEQSISYSGVIAISGSTIAVSDASITEIPVTVTTRLQFDYFRTNQPQTIILPKAPRALVVGSTGYMIHGWGALVAGQEMLCEDATLRQWRGKIYERIQRFKEVRRLSEEI